MVLVLLEYIVEPLKKQGEILGKDQLQRHRKRVGKDTTYSTAHILAH